MWAEGCEQLPLGTAACGCRPAQAAKTPLSTRYSIHQGQPLSGGGPHSHPHPPGPAPPRPACRVPSQPHLGPCCAPWGGKRAAGASAAADPHHQPHAPAAGGTTLGTQAGLLLLLLLPMGCALPTSCCVMECPASQHGRVNSQWTVQAGGRRLPPPLEPSREVDGSSHLSQPLCHPTHCGAGDGPPEGAGSQRDQVLRGARLGTLWWVVGRGKVGGGGGGGQTSWR